MNQSDIKIAKNVLGQPLVACSFKPMTGYFRDGACRTNEQDLGTHVVCIVATREFLAFSLRTGNDLSTPRPQWQFAGLKPGDQWCLCANRWQEAYESGAAPTVVLESTHQRVLDFVSLEALQRYAKIVDDAF